MRVSTGVRKGINIIYYEQVKKKNRAIILIVLRKSYIIIAFRNVYESHVCRWMKTLFRQSSGLYIFVKVSKTIGAP